MSPRPWTMLINPLGNCAACTHSAISCVCQVLISLGLVTTAQPEASAAAVLLKK